MGRGIDVGRFDKCYANMVSSAALEKNRKDSAANLRDGKLGEHIGYGPKMKSGSSADVSKGREWNVQYEGKGEMGKILLDFQWNMQEAAAGWAEAAKPIYDQKLWEAGGFMEPPTVRQITDVGMQVVSGVLSAAVAAGTAGIAVGFAPLIGFGVNAIDDLLFAGLDMGTTKNAGDVWADFGKKTVVNAVSSAIGYGFSGVEVGASALAKGALAATETMTTTVATSIVGAIDFKTGAFDGNAFRESAGLDGYGVGFIANALASGVSAGVGGMFSGALNAAEMKNYGGLVSLTSSMYGEAAKYGVYTASSLASGNGWNSFAKAYDDMGGLTVNVANIGAIFDFAMSSMARLNNSAQFADSGSGIKFVENVRSELGKIGVMEVNLGLEGVSGRIGTGGIDVGGAAYYMAKRGIDNARIQLAMSGEENKSKREAALTLYGWGDWTAENTSMRISSGLDDLVFDKDIDRVGLTVSNGKGGRTITIKDSGNVNLNAVALQHEAYRDGNVIVNNNLETQRAVTAHTEMALRMLNSGQDLPINFILFNDISAYLGSAGDMSLFNKYVDENYDSSADSLDFKFPGGKTIIHAFDGDPFGWGSGSFQKWLGYCLEFDFVANYLVDFNAISVELGDITFRSWKGDYNIWGGITGESGLYDRNGNALTDEKLAELGIRNSSISIYEVGTNNLIKSYTANEAGYWIHISNPGLGALAINSSNRYTKNDIYTVTTYTFDSEKNASAFRNRFTNDILMGANNYQFTGNGQVNEPKLNGRQLELTYENKK